MSLPPTWLAKLTEALLAPPLLLLGVLFALLEALAAFLELLA